MGLRYLLLLSVLVWGLSVVGQEPDLSNQGLETDTIAGKKMSSLLIPIALYTPETSFAFGGGGQLFFKTKKTKNDQLNSTMLVSAIYTVNNQITIEAQPQIYFNYDQYFLDAKFRYNINPYFFWGVGPTTPDSAEEKYSQTEISLSAALLKTLSAKVNFGFEFNFAKYTITDKIEGGLLASGEIEGSDGAQLVGLGVVLNVDQRDNKFSPLHGGFYQFKTNFSSRVLGSTHSYNTYFLDLRKYLNLGRNNILAIQFYTRFTFGNAPFQGQSYYGGANVARGYFRGRYIDDHLYVAQLEYRMPIKKRWEMAAFVLTGNVGNSEPGTGLFSDSKPSFGCGPRYFIYKDKRTVLRLDIGVNRDGNTGIYFGVNEAF